jgi:hypothetical protein
MSEHLLRERGVGSSNLLAPTNYFNDLIIWILRDAADTAPETKLFLCSSELATHEQRPWKDLAVLLFIEPRTLDVDNFRPGARRVSTLPILGVDDVGCVLTSLGSIAAGSAKFPPSIIRVFTEPRWALGRKRLWASTDIEIMERESTWAVAQNSPKDDE